MTPFHANHRFRRCVVLVTGCLIAVGAVCTCAFAAEHTGHTNARSAAGSSSIGPHCGVSCLYAALHLYGRAVHLKDLLQPQYIESSKGSSFLGLKKAAEDNGLYAVALRNLTASMLRHSPYLMILRVKSGSPSETYDHYVLFLGTESGQAKVFNPAHPPELVAFRELSPRWSGEGLILSRRPIHRLSLFAPYWQGCALWFFGALASVVFIRVISRRLLSDRVMPLSVRFALSLGQTVLLALAVLLWAFLWHLARAEGLLANATATEATRQIHAGDFIRKINISNAERLLRNHAIVVDARYTCDYEAGHLEGAVSVPVDANDAERQRTLAAVAKDKRVVVYCQSSRCPFAEKVAIRLIEDGFSDVRIYRGGWSEWVARHGLAAATPKENLRRSS
jgi:rhodanese-related sulfurtransferase